jgi:hypothetical protein
MVVVVDLRVVKEDDGVGMVRDQVVARTRPHGAGGVGVEERGHCRDCWLVLTRGILVGFARD